MLKFYNSILVFVIGSTLTIGINIEAMHHAKKYCGIGNIISRLSSIGTRFFYRKQHERTSPFTIKKYLTRYNQIPRTKSGSLLSTLSALSLCNVGFFSKKSQNYEISPVSMLEHHASTQLEQLGSGIRTWKQKQAVMEQAIEDNIKKLRSIEHPDAQQRRALALAQQYEDFVIQANEAYKDFILKGPGQHRMLNVYISRENLRRFCVLYLVDCEGFSESAYSIQEYGKLTDDLETRQLELALDISKNARPTLQEIYESQYKEENFGKVERFSFPPNIDLQSPIPIHIVTPDRTNIPPIEGREIWGHLSQEHGAHIAIMPFWSQSRKFICCLWQHKEAGSIIEFILKREIGHIKKLHGMRCGKGIISKHDEEFEADRYAIQDSPSIQYGSMCFFTTALLYTFLSDVYMGFKRPDYPDIDNDITRRGLHGQAQETLAQENQFSPKLIVRFLKCAEGTSQNVRLNSVEQAMSLIEKTDDVLLNTFREEYPIIYNAALNIFRAHLEKLVLLTDKK